jgi:hypothetical protein
MLFVRHHDLIGKHAYLSASKPHWINYSDDKLDRVYSTHMTAAVGSELHDIAAKLIKHGLKQPRSKKTFNMYVNDAIGYRMTPEQPLYYSDNAFGTADAIAFRNNKLRIHDLKNGVTPSNVKQLLVYAALFCLEYNFKPFEIEIELRIYQNDEVKIYDADPHDVHHVMDKIITFDRRINEMRMEALS